jgi:corrinoid protein of di/trimethylamine methyltransferase
MAERRLLMDNQDELVLALRQAVVDGDKETLVQLVEKALNAGVDPYVILDEGLTKGTDTVGNLFETGEYFLPELMLTGIALKAAMELVVPRLKLTNSALERGVIVIATIKSDVHDIGKNLVSSMLAASGFDVHDLGVDVPINRIIDEANQVGADIIGCSALLTTSFPYLRELVSTIDERGLRDRFKIMVGGASITQDFADKIGADGTAPNAAGAVTLAKRLMTQVRNSQGERT